MNTILIDGKKLKQKVLLELEKEMLVLSEKGIKPHLTVVQLGDDDASNIYVLHKQRVAKTLGIEFSWIKLPLSTTFKELEEQVSLLNKDPKITGIIIQFPLPDGFSKTKVAKLVIPSKDADGIHPENQIKVKEGNLEDVPITCTPKGIMRMFDEYNISLKDKKAVVLGRSRIVGNPMANLLKVSGARVDVINSQTSLEDKNAYLKNADIIISATGYKNVFTFKDVKDGVVIIDVGIIRDEKKIRGDVEYKEFISKASHITPVPGGVGPMTVTMLMSNVIELAKEKIC